MQGGSAMSAQSPESYRLIEIAKECLRSRLPTADADLSCDYVDGVLCLRGRSNSFYEKQMAQEAVRHVEGVSQVVNQITVAHPTWA
jgi:osmotically-inducible protein OsmY